MPIVAPHANSYARIDDVMRGDARISFPDHVGDGNLGDEATLKTVAGFGNDT